MPFANWSRFEWGLLAGFLLLYAVGHATDWHGVLNAMFTVVSVGLLGYFCFMAARLVWLLFKPLE